MCMHIYSRERREGAYVVQRMRQEDEARNKYVCCRFWVLQHSVARLQCIATATHFFADLWCACCINITIRIYENEQQTHKKRAIGNRSN